MQNWMFMCMNIVASYRRIKAKTSKAFSHVSVRPKNLIGTSVQDVIYRMIQRQLVLTSSAACVLRNSLRTTARLCTWYHISFLLWFLGQLIRRLVGSRRILRPRHICIGREVVPPVSSIKDQCFRGRCALALDYPL
jgi:hypothetical protein